MMKNIKYNINDLLNSIKKNNKEIENLRVSNIFINQEILDNLDFIEKLKELIKSTYNINSSITIHGFVSSLEFKSYVLVSYEDSENNLHQEELEFFNNELKKIW